ncbi:hypothetical protein [Pseudomonas aeruginosa]|uniref:hypothetical protein n=1 Tax=Pseudomonas aeruginosa TaxID=287 RepID=UPI000B9C21B0|nr:hypothetical protein [Pseudomonas aeruginosa]OXT86557.1 hypothetical protein CF340_13475 [Pseudomonas aeruginosa]
MKERPILFNDQMVRAILEGRKTVTRRVVSPQPDFLGSMVDPNTPFKTLDAGLHARITCPYGEPGDRLWVRETWMDLRGTGVEHRPTPDSPLQRYAYGADSPPGSVSDEARKDFGLKWRPSIHMPRTACRILLEVTAVRVERLHAITRSDIRAEGLQCPPELCSDDVSPNYRDWYPAAWRELWESTGGDWDANPWVWVIEFKRVTPCPPAAQQSG